jgi:hypothetical protein
MAIVTERMSPADILKYGELEKNSEWRFVLNPEKLPQWTIDRERNIYLRELTPDWQQPSRSRFVFYYKGSYFLFRTETSVVKASETTFLTEVDIYPKSTADDVLGDVRAAFEEFQYACIDVPPETYQFTYK